MDVTTFTGAHGMVHSLRDEFDRSSAQLSRMRFSSEQSKRRAAQCVAHAMKAGCKTMNFIHKTAKKKQKKRRYTRAQEMDACSRPEVQLKAASNMSTYLSFFAAVVLSVLVNNFLYHLIVVAAVYYFVRWIHKFVSASDGVSQSAQATLPLPLAR